MSLDEQWKAERERAAQVIADDIARHLWPLQPLAA